jgi:flagellar protein FlgJ
MTRIQPMSRLPGTNTERAQISEAAEGFEQMFVSEMLKEMRKTLPENNISKRNTTEQFFQGMLDNEYAGVISKHNDGLGIANLIEDQLLEKATSQSQH